MTSLIAPLCRAHQVDQFPYLVFPNRTLDEKVMGFQSFHISEPTHVDQTDLAYR
jgi:hypothetical protein